MISAPSRWRARLERALLSLWFPADRPGLLARWVTGLLVPLACVTAAVAGRRRARIVRQHADACPPVLVIGNLVVGGTGKTPLTIAVARALAARGLRIGLLASGYRGARSDPRLVTADDDAAAHGDEAVLLALGTGLPVAAGRRRALALAVLLDAHPALDLVISDDGLQHAGLERRLELAVFDARGAGNGRMLPAGPLREPLSDAATMDALLLKDDAQRPVAGPPAFRFHLVPTRFRRLIDDHHLPPDAFARMSAGTPVAAIAGIARPERFFDTLTALGIAANVWPLADHAAIDAALLAGIPARFVLMTTKDAVKCRHFADDRCWVLDTEALIDPALIPWIAERLDGHPTA